MSVVTGRSYGLGLAKARLFELNASGSPNASSETPYIGTEIVGPQDFTLTIPDAQKKTHLGNNQALQVDFLPPTEAVSGSMKVSEEDQTLYALVTATKKLTIAEKTMIGVGTNKQGFEPQVGFLAMQQALDENGVRNWITAICPRAILYPHRGNMDANPAVHNFIIAPTFVTKHLWEVAFTANAEGFTRAQICMWQSRYPFMVASYLMGAHAGGAAACAMPADYPIAEEGKVAVWKNGALLVVTTDYTVDVDLEGVSLVGATSADDRIVILYEYPESS